MPQIAQFRDFFELVPPTQEDFQAFEDSKASSSKKKKGLEVTFVATNSGKVNHNLRLYLPSLMEEGADSFINRKKPAKILKHHNGMSDPVGKITGSEYVSNIPDSLKDDPNVKIMTDKELPIDVKLKAVRNFIASRVPLSSDFQGLGYIKLKGLILDNETIEQIKDGRYDEVSTSFHSPGLVFCSECGTNLTKDDCEHYPGRIYYEDEEEKTNGAICVIVPGKHLYDECSLVVNPADSDTEIKFGDMKETLVSLGDTDKTIKEYQIARKEIFSDDASYVLKNDEEEPMKLSDSQQKVFEVIKNLRPEMSEEDAKSMAVKIEAMVDKDGVYPNQLEAEIDNNTAIEYILDDLETSEEEINADEVYEELEKELVSLELEDAKLSTKQRKDLPASAFCGPNRSFPVNDCAHVTAARRLLGRYKGPGNKTSILACINRKAKSLGCDSSDSTKPDDQEPTNDFVLPTCEAIKSLNDEDMLLLFSMAETELIDRKKKLPRECSSCAEAHALKDKAVAEKELTTDELNKLSSKVVALREEFRLQAADYQNLVSDYALLGAKLDDLKRDKLSLMKVLSGSGKMSLDEAKDSLKQADLERAEITISDNFDLEKISDKLFDGMDHTPSGEQVGDPSVHPDNQGEPEFTAREQIAIKRIEEALRDKNETEAYRLYDKFVSIEVINPTKITFEKIAEDATEDNSGGNSNDN
jgi:hypothetical protein